MTKKELLAALAQYPDDHEIVVLIGDPKDTAFTNDVSVDNVGRLVGWVATDNDRAFAPWGDPDERGED